MAPFTSIVVDWTLFAVNICILLVTDTSRFVLSGEMKSAGYNCLFSSLLVYFRYQRGSPQTKTPCSQETTLCVQATPCTAAPPWWPSAPAPASTSSCWTLWVLLTHFTLNVSWFPSRSDVHCCCLLSIFCSTQHYYLSLAVTFYCFYCPVAAFIWENTHYAVNHSSVLHVYTTQSGI